MKVIWKVSSHDSEHSKALKECWRGMSDLLDLLSQELKAQEDSTKKEKS